jgi:hypothetical protein
VVAGKSEALDVEYKAWLDTGDPTTRAKLAKHIVALENHGGGSFEGVGGLSPRAFALEALFQKFVYR